MGIYCNEKDKNTMVETLSSIYNSRLQMLLGYHNYDFTRELVKYMFRTFDQLSNELGVYYGHNITEAVQSLLDNQEKTELQTSTYIMEIASRLELYAKCIERTYVKKEIKGEMDDYRKRLTRQFTATVESNKKLFPERMHNSAFINPIIHQMCRSVGLRNYFVHDKSFGKTYQYKGYIYLCSYDIILAYLLYAFYHMSFIKSPLLNKMLTKNIFGLGAPVPKNRILGEAPTMERPQPLEIQREWHYTRHIYADYLLNPSVGYLFGWKATTPPSDGNDALSRLTEQVRALEQVNSEEDRKRLKELKEERNRLKGNWSSFWSNRLVEFYQLRLLGNPARKEQYQFRKEKYCSLFQIILKKMPEKTNMVYITQSFVEMLGDYLYHNVPVENKDERPLTCLQTVRTCYKSCKHSKDYIDFEANPYAKALMDMMEELADLYPHNVDKHPLSRHFLAVSEYLLSLSVYIYMVELLIHVRNEGRGIPSHDFMNYINNYDNYAREARQ